MNQEREIQKARKEIERRDAFIAGHQDKIAAHASRKAAAEKIIADIEGPPATEATPETGPVAGVTLEHVTHAGEGDGILAVVTAPDLPYLDDGFGFEARPKAEAGLHHTGIDVEVSLASHVIITRALETSRGFGNVETHAIGRYVQAITGEEMAGTPPTALLTVRARLKFERRNDDGYTEDYVVTPWTPMRKYRLERAVVYGSFVGWIPVLMEDEA